MNETTVLLSKDSTSKQLSKKEYFAKNGCLVIFAVVCGLGIVFAVLMTKWYLISQSVITPTVSSHNVEFYPVDEFEAGRKDINADCPPGVWGCAQSETPDRDDAYDAAHDRAGHDADEKDIEADCPPGIWCEGSEKAEHDGEEHDEHDEQRGATAKQFGKAFPLTILAKIAWKDLSNMLTFGVEHDDDCSYGLAQSVSMLPVYISEQDCSDAVDYFEKQEIVEDKDCQYVDLNNFVLNFGKSKNDGECEDNNDESGTEVQEMFRITNRIIDYFCDNYANYLIDCEISDIRMIKYLSNGTRYSGLHSETHYIDGKRIVINEREPIQVDYVAIAFLNDNFAGGNLQFISPQSIDIIKPQIGNGVLFGGGLDYAHRVTPVTNGHRYIVKIIFNKN